MIKIFAMIKRRLVKIWNFVFNAKLTKFIRLFRNGILCKQQLFFHDIRVKNGDWVHNITVLL